MIHSTTNVRVRYAETDQMGYVYYGNYAQYCELGRVEMLRNLGFSYKSLEEQGIMMPVLEFNLKYVKPAHYDELLTITTVITEMPSVRIRFDYQIFNAEGQLLNEAWTTLVFVNKASGRPCRAPENLMAAMQLHFESA